jgi:serine/threonine-protein kinase
MNPGLFRSRYRVGQPLGRGGQSQVFQAFDLVLGRHVALKVAPDGVLTGSPTAVASREETAERLRREALFLARVSHPHVVTLLDASLDESPFLVMELLRGSSLRDRIRTKGPLEPRRAVRATLQLLSGLEALHQRGLVHRDIKPANLFLFDAEGLFDVVKIFDLGAAVPREREGERDRLTPTGMQLGTTGYMAPELALGVPASPSSDLYASAIVLYECIAGRRPFERRPGGVSAAQILAGTPFRPIEGLHPAIAHVLRRALALEPRDRFTSAADMGATLAEALPTMSHAHWEEDEQSTLRDIDEVPPLDAG